MNENKIVDEKLTDAEKEIIKKLAISYDNGSKGYLEFDEFLGFMKAATGMKKIEDFDGEVPESGRVPVLQMKFLYDGIDVRGSNSMQIDDVCSCFINYKERNFDWLEKMIFIGCDIEKNNSVFIEDISNAIQNIGEKPLSPEEFQQKCIEEYGREKQKINFSQFLYILSGKNQDIDPYEGKAIKKTKCCVLL